MTYVRTYVCYHFLTYGTYVCIYVSSDVSAFTVLVPYQYGTVQCTIKNLPKNLIDNNNFHKTLE